MLARLFGSAPRSRDDEINRALAESAQLLKNRLDPSQRTKGLVFGGDLPLLRMIDVVKDSAEAIIAAKAAVVRAKSDTFSNAGIEAAQDSERARKAEHAAAEAELTAFRSAAEEQGVTLREVDECKHVEESPDDLLRQLAELKQDQQSAEEASRQPTAVLALLEVKSEIDAQRAQLVEAHARIEARARELEGTEAEVRTLRERIVEQQSAYEAASAAHESAEERISLSHHETAAQAAAAAARAHASKVDSIIKSVGRSADKFYARAACHTVKLICTKSSTVNRRAFERLDKQTIRDSILGKERQVACQSLVLEDISQITRQFKILSLQLPADRPIVYFYPKTSEELKAFADALEAYTAKYGNPLTAGLALNITGISKDRGTKLSEYNVLRDKYLAWESVGATPQRIHRLICHIADDRLGLVRKTAAEARERRHRAAMTGLETQLREAESRLAEQAAAIERLRSSDLSRMQVAASAAEASVAAFAEDSVSGIMQRLDQLTVAHGRHLKTAGLSDFPSSEEIAEARAELATRKAQNLADQERVVDRLHQLYTGKSEECYLAARAVAEAGNDITHARAKAIFAAEQAVKTAEADHATALDHLAVIQAITKIRMNSEAARAADEAKEATIFAKIGSGETLTRAEEAWLKHSDQDGITNDML